MAAICQQHFIIHKKRVISPLVVLFPGDLTCGKHPVQLLGVAAFADIDAEIHFLTISASFNAAAILQRVHDPAERQQQKPIGLEIYGSAHLAGTFPNTAGLKTPQFRMTFLLLL